MSELPLRFVSNAMRVPSPDQAGSMSLPRENVISRWPLPSGAMTKMESLEILLLGPLEVRRDGVALRLGGAKPRALLANLALNLGVAVSTDRIVDDLWGERPTKSAAHGVEVYVSRLRGLVGP